MLYLVSEFDLVDEYGKEAMGYHSLWKLCCCAKWWSSQFQDILLSALRDESFKWRWQ